MRNDTKKWADDFTPNKLAGTHMPISVEVAAAHGHPHTAAEGDAIARKALQSILKDALPAAIAKTQAEMNQAAAKLRVDADLRFGQVQELCDKVDGWLQNKSEGNGHAQLTIPLATDRTKAADTYNACQRTLIDAAEKIRQKKLEIAAAIEEYSLNFAESDIPKQLQSLMADDTLPVRVMAKDVRNLLRILAGQEYNGFQKAFGVESTQSSLLALNKVLKELNSNVEDALNDWKKHFSFVAGAKSDRSAMEGLLVRDQFDALSRDIFKDHTAIEDCNQKLKEKGSFIELSPLFEQLVSRHLGNVSAER